MKLINNLYFYKGDNADPFKHYKGIASSNYLILAGEEQILFDIGFLQGRHRKRLINEMNNDGLLLSNTKQIFFTHYHSDHVTGAKYLLKKYNIKLHFHHDCEEYLHNATYQLAAYSNYPYIIEKEIYPKSKLYMSFILLLSGYYFDYFRADYLLQSYETLLFNNCNIEILPAFGHCPGHVMYYFPKYKVLFSGDVFNLDVYNTTLLSNAQSEYEESINDVNLMLTKEIDILIPGHGDKIEGSKNISDFLTSIKNNTIQLKNKIIEILQENEMTLTGLYETIMPLYNLYTYHRKPIIYSILKHLKRKKVINCRVVNKQLYWFCN